MDGSSASLIQQVLNPRGPATELPASEQASASPVESAGEAIERIVNPGRAARAAAPGPGDAPPEPASVLLL